jgi:hypothetical protein
MRTLRAAYGRQDWDALAAAVGYDITLTNHRRYATGSPRSRDVFLDGARLIEGLQEVHSFRLVHQPRLSARAAVEIVRMRGAVVGGGDFETTYAIVLAHDGDQLHSLDLYDLDDLDVAYAHYDRLTSGETTPRGNAATRVMAEIREVAERRDWDAVRTLLSPHLHVEDRRPHALYTFDRDAFVADLPALYSGANLQIDATLLRTCGESLALERVGWSGRGERGTGEFEVEYLWLIEADADGRLTSGIMFRPDAMAEAEQELENRAARALAAHDTTVDEDPHVYERFLAGDDVPCADMFAVVRAYQAAFDAHDYDALRATIADEFVLHDHRPAELGEIVGGDTYVASVRALHRLAPVGTAELAVALAFDSHGCLGVCRVRGNLAEGGEFEKEFLGLFHVRDGRLHRYEFFDTADAAGALTRFEELRAESS